MSTSSAPAEVDFAVRGTVVDAHTLEPVPQLMVLVVEGQQLRAVTDREGEFEIRGRAAPGRYKLRMMRVGYGRQIRRFRVRQAGMVDMGTIKVRSRPLILDIHPAATSN